MPRLLNSFAASRILGITSDQLRRLAEAGEIPHVRLPGRFDDPLRFEESDLWEFARAHRQAALGHEQTTSALPLSTH